MSVLTVWTFADPATARRAETLLASLSAQGAVAVEDGAVVIWPESRRNPRTRELSSIAITSALGPSFWGMLFGTVFIAPRLGRFAGTDVDALTGSLQGVGIDDHFVQGMRDAITPGRSALLALTAAVPLAADGITSQAAQHFHRALDDVQRRALYRVFTE